MCPIGENRKCPYCEKVCLNRLQKLKHLRMAHPKECFASSSESDIFRCSKCDKKFFVKRACENHEFKVHAIPHFKKLCKDCGRGYNHDSHMCPRKKGQKYKCSNCEKVYLNPTNLRLHIKREHLKERNHLCEPCNKYFAHENLLKAHIYQSHSKINCEICDKPVMNKGALKRHMVLEHGVKDNAILCNICPKSLFYHEANYKKHMLDKHNIKVDENKDKAT